MKTNLYAIYDKQHEIHGQIFQAHNDELAGRTFQQIKDNPESSLHKYPGDFKLVRLANYDLVLGTITPNRESLN